MPRIAFSPNIRTHVDVEARDVSGATVREALEDVFAEHPRLRGYLFDDRGAVRKHIAIFVDGSAITDRDALSDPLLDNSEIFVMQALSGG